MRKSRIEEISNSKWKIPNKNTLNKNSKELIISNLSRKIEEDFNKEKKQIFPLISLPTINLDISLCDTKRSKDIKSARENFDPNILNLDSNIKNLGILIKNEDFGFYDSNSNLKNFNAVKQKEDFDLNAVDLNFVCKNNERDLNGKKIDFVGTKNEFFENDIGNLDLKQLRSVKKNENLNNFENTTANFDLNNKNTGEKNYLKRDTSKKLFEKKDLENNNLNNDTKKNEELKFLKKEISEKKDLNLKNFKIDLNNIDKNGVNGKINNCKFKNKYLEKKLNEVKNSEENEDFDNIDLKIEINSDLIKKNKEINNDLVFDEKNDHSVNTLKINEIIKNKKKLENLKEENNKKKTEKLKKKDENIKIIINTNENSSKTEKKQTKSKKIIKNPIKNALTPEKMDEISSHILDNLINNFFEDNLYKFFFLPEKIKGIKTGYNYIKLYLTALKSKIQRKIKRKLQIRNNKKPKHIAPTFNPHKNVLIPQNGHRSLPLKPAKPRNPVQPSPKRANIPRPRKRILRNLKSQQISPI